MSQYLSTFWDSNYPNPTAGACVALKHMKLVNIACDNSQKNFYDFTAGYEPFLDKSIKLTKNVQISDSDSTGASTRILYTLETNLIVL